MSDQPAMSPERIAELFGAARTGDGDPAGAFDAGRHHRPSSGGAPRSRSAGGATSDLSIDETLLLHSIGWEPVDLVVGASVASLPAQVFSWTTSGWNGPDAASGPFTSAMASAVARMRNDCNSAGGHGVIGVEVEVAVHQHVAEVTLVGTAVRPVGASGGHSGAWMSDLSTRDFALLHGAGWSPLGLAFGTAFAQVPYRKIGQVFSQAGQNVELENYTNALYEARELGMGRLQESAQRMGAAGVVAVQLVDRPLPFASHVVGFTCWGTAVALTAGVHTNLRPRVVVSMRDRVDRFDVARGIGGDRPS
ncbi:MAG TPA: heavy metal-binding domain-containing protein [Acidimicrobiales bacterium]|nr:heavy metal-binding domain-containing protein [Acidimicrobiales bacterium]